MHGASSLFVAPPTHHPTAIQGSTSSGLGKKIILAAGARTNGKINRAAKFNGFAAQEMRDTPLE